MTRDSAAPAASGPTEAAEVLVVGAALAAVPSIAESASAGAVDGAGQVVHVLLGAVATGSVTVQHCLDLLEGGGVDQRVVPPLKFHAATGDDAGVVVVAQDAVERASRDGTFRPSRGRSCSQTHIRETSRSVVSV